MRAVRKPRSRSEALLAHFVLPISGVAVGLLQPTGVEDLLLTEHRLHDPALALALAERLGRTDVPLNWADLPVSDIDTFILRLRQALLGNRVIAEITCTNESCGERVDLSFSVDAYLAHHEPRRGRSRKRGLRVEPFGDEPGWFVLHAPAFDSAGVAASGSGTAAAQRGNDPMQAQEILSESLPAAAETLRFRLPSLADQIAVDGLPDAVGALAERCIRPGGLPGRARARIENAMAMLAPPLAGPLRGHCPHCTTPIAARFEARLYCLQELRDRARFIYDDIDALAERYHWSERAILMLPHVRRTSYVERARQAGLS